MEIKQYLQSINIDKEGSLSDDNAYVIDLTDSNEYGKIYSKLEKAEDLDIMYDNQVITEQGSSLVYESLSEPLLLNLIADFEADKYQLIVNLIEE